MGGDDLLHASVQGLLYQHPVLARLPGVEPLLDPPPDSVVCSNISGLFQDHCLKDNEPLQVPLSFLHPTQIFDQCPLEETPYLPTWRVVAPGGDDHKVMPPPLPRLVVCYDSIEVSSGIGMRLVPVDLLDSEVLSGWGVSQQISLLPFPVLWLQRLVAPALSLRPSGIRSGSSRDVADWSFPFSFPTCARPCLPLLRLYTPPLSLPQPLLLLMLCLPHLLLAVSRLGSNVDALPQTSA